MIAAVEEEAGVRRKHP